MREYEEIIKGKKTLNVRSVRFISHGIPRSGKTTFWRRLMKLIEIDDKEQLSTGLADIQAPVLIMKLGSGMVTPDEWHVFDEGEYAKKLIQMLSKVVHAKSSTIPQPGTPANASPIVNTSTSGRAPLAGSDAQASDASVEPDFRSTRTSAPVPDMERSFTSLFNKALESDSDWESLKCELEDIILLSSADTGGHAEFQDMHPALINGPSFNLFFSRLTDELGEPFKVYYTDEDHTSTQAEDSDSTVEEVMFRILSSIVCFGESHWAHETSDAMKALKSKVMFVGTFKDQVSDEEFKRKDAELQRQIRGTAFFKDVMFANHDKGQLMLKVNNKSGGESEVEDNRRILKEKIERCFPRIPIPASWLLLSLEIRNHPHPTMTLEHCEMLARKLNIEQKELQIALWFLHHRLGVLLYYPVGGLKATVFSKIQAIYKSINDLTEKTYTARFVLHETSLCEFKNLGIFSLEEIEIAPDSLIPRNLLVQLLQHLNIVTSAPPALSPTGIKNPYLMPCLLRSSRQGIYDPFGENPEPLKLRFKCGFTPVGVFPAMITKLVRDSKWMILPERNRIFKNRVRFGAGRSIIYLMSHLRYFEMVLLPKHPAPELFRSVREVFDDTLKKVIENMNYNFLRGHEFAFWCTAAECIDCEKHLAVVKETTSAFAFLECCRDKAVTADLNPGQKVWFHKGKKDIPYSALFSRCLNFEVFADFFLPAKIAPLKLT